MMDLISRQAAIDVLYKNYILGRGDLNEVLDHIVDRLEKLPSAQPETCEDTISRQAAVKHLDLFTKAYCRDKSITDDLAFRCKQCEFEMPDGRCLVKVMARKLCPDYKDFGAMGDL